MQSSPQIPTLVHLRAEAAARGITPTTADLEAVLGFLAVLLPAAAEVEQMLPPDAVPADPYLGGEVP